MPRNIILYSGAINYIVGSKMTFLSKLAEKLRPERQVVINLVEHPLDRSYLTREELQKGIVLLPCILCRDTTRHIAFQHKPYTSNNPWDPLKAQCKTCGHVRRF
jgi:hypothetical protein